MSYLNTKDLIDTVATLIQDNSATLRSKLLSWLNLVGQDIVDAKRLSPPWQWLHKTTDLTIASNMIAKPSDFGQVVNITIGTSAFLMENDRLTDEEAYLLTDDNATNPTPAGWTTNTTSIIFYPGATGTATLKYAQELEDYEESVSDTIYPKWMRNAIVRGMLRYYYEYDVDERSMLAESLYHKALAKAMKRDNSTRPTPKRNRNGYTRDRV